MCEMIATYTSQQQIFINYQWSYVVTKSIHFRCIWWNRCMDLCIHRSITLSTIARTNNHAIKVLGHHQTQSHLLDNWRCRPSFPSRSQVRTGRPPEDGLPSSTASLGSCTVTRTPLETVLLRMTGGLYRRPPMGSPWALHSHPRPHECINMALLQLFERWSRRNQLLELKLPVNTLMIHSSL